MANSRKLLINADMVWGLILTSGSALLLVLAYQPQKVTIFSSGSGMLWPQYVLWPLFGLSLLLLVKGFLAIPRESLKSGDYQHLFRPLILSLLTLGCFALITTIGFLPFTLVFASSTAFIMGQRRPLAIAIFSIAMTLAIWLIFANGLDLALPRGISVFRDLSFMMY